MSTTQLQLSAESNRALIESGLPTERFLEIALEAPRQEPTGNRAPLNVALVLDRSGSMAGEKLDYVRRAACHVLDTLTDQDRAAVVVYDDEIAILSRSEVVTPANREAVKRKIRKIRDGSSTNLGGGWLRGAQEVADNLREDGVNRALLLTDGLANVGMTEPHELAAHARELRQRRVSTSTFGVGLGFNEYLLESMAENGGGRFYFIQDPERIPAIFGEELGELLTVTAREVMLRIYAPSDVKVELLGAIPHEKTAECITVPIGDLCSGQRQALYLKLLTPPGKAGDRVEIRLEATYAAADSTAGVVRAKSVLTYAPAADVASAPRNRRVEEGAAEVDLAAAMTDALVMERSGDRVGAALHMRLRAAVMAPMAPASAIDDIGSFADHLELGLTEEVRKSTHSTAYTKRRGRS